MRVAASLGLALALVGCKPQVSGELPICAAEVADGSAAESQARELPAEVWYSILLQGFDRTQMLAGEDPKDCTGTSTLRSTSAPIDDGGPAPRCTIDDDEHVSARLPTRPLTEDDLVLGEGPRGTTLVWVQATQLDGGDAIGPVALVEWTRAGVAVRGLGSLRAPTTKARLRIEAVGEQRLLVVEADSCNAADSKLCTRVMRLLPLVDGRFLTVPLELDAAESSDQAGDVCLGEPTFPLYERHSADLPDGWIRKFEIVRSVRFEGGVPLVAEHVVIRDQDPNQPDAPAQEFREASSERALVYRSGRFETRPSLWDDMIASYGSVAHDQAP